MNEYPEHLKRAADAIQATRKAVAEFQRASEDGRKAVDEMEHQLRSLGDSYEPAMTTDIKLMMERLYRLRELRNQMEPGAFTIASENALMHALQRLP